MVRIAFLLVLLIALLTPSLRSGATDQVATPLHPTPNYPFATGTVWAVVQAGRVTLTLDVHGLPVTTSRLYVVWVVTADRQLYNAGALTVDQRGDVTGELVLSAVTSGSLLLGISAEQRADLVAPTAPQSNVVLSGQLPDPSPRTTDHLTANLGPDWLVPIIPASLGFLLLRHAGRLRKAERQRAMLLAQV